MTATIFFIKTFIPKTFTSHKQFCLQNYSGGTKIIGKIYAEERLIDETEFEVIAGNGIREFPHSGSRVYHRILELANDYFQY
jgi:hypothetical protein